MPEYTLNGQYGFKTSGGLAPSLAISPDTYSANNPVDFSIIQYSAAQYEIMSDPLNNGDEVRLMTLENGAYLNVRKRDDPGVVGYYQLRAYYSDGTLASTLFGVNPQTETVNDKYYLGITMAVYDGQPALMSALMYRRANTQIWYGIFNQITYLDTWLANQYQEVPTYIWHSWPQLSGNADQFLINLSTIDDTIIDDGETAYETFDSTKFTLSEQSKLYNLVINLLNGQETTIAYCGDNYLTATKRTTYVNDVTTIYVTLKFYFRSGTRIYTAPELTVWSSNPDISQDYLSIIFDADAEVAASDIIHYYTTTGKYGINYYSLPSDEEMRALYIWLQDNGEYREQISPYDTGTTDNGGDPGTPTPQDHITDSPLPTLGGLDLGVVTLYLPTPEQMQSIAAFLWSDNVLDNFKKYFNNFADNLLSLYVLPFTPSGLNTKTFKVGNMVSEITDVAFCTTRYIDRDMGTFNLEKLWDSYLDFSPYTRIELYLPYLGLHSLDTDELMCPAKMDGTLQRGLGSVLSLTYRLDLLTGVIVAKVKVNGEIRYQYEGKVGLNIPLTGQTYAQMAQAIVQAGAGVATTIASGGLTAPLTAAAAVTGTVNASKPNVERIGNISGDASMLATNVPYLIVTRPNKPKLESQEIYTGFPSYKAGTLGSFSGFTQVIEAHVEGISCTEEERTLILKWLKEGIII